MVVVDSLRHEPSTKCCFSVDGPSDGSFREFSGEIGGVFILKKHGSDPLRDVLGRPVRPFCGVAIQ